MSKIVLTDEVKALVAIAAPSAVYSLQENPVVLFLQELVDAVNAASETGGTPDEVTTTTADPNILI